MEEEQLDPKAAVVAVLNDNIYGLELDERCTQIAAFNVALTAWKIAGYQTLPPFHLACSGHAPSATESEWTALAGRDERLRRGMMRLYGLFKDAPVLGSLINPRTAEGESARRRRFMNSNRCWRSRLLKKPMTMPLLKWP